MPEMTTEESRLFAADLEDAESMSRASLSFRCARALSVLRTVWKSRRELQDRVAEREEWCGKLHTMYSGAEHYIDDLEDELRPLRTQRSDAYIILAQTAFELGAAEDTRWEFLPEMVRELRAHTASLESQLSAARAEITGHRDGAAAAQRAMDDMHADLTAARERITELEAQIGGAQ